MTRLAATGLGLLFLGIAGCGPGPGTHARVTFRNETDPAKAPAMFRMPLASVALVGETDRDVFWRADEDAAPIDFTSDVNDQVGSSMRNLSLGEYSHVEVRLCDAGTATVEWQASAASAPRSFETPCVKTQPLADAIAVSGGEQVTVVLEYDAAVTLRRRDAGDDCDGSDCFAVPAFVPRLDVEIVVE